MKKLFICMVSGRNALGDSYKNIINEFPDKNEIIAIIPENYCKEEFSPDFNQVIVDKISHVKWRLLKACRFAVALRKLVLEKKIKKVFFYFDNHWFNAILYLFLLGLNIKFFMWVHDPVLHLGANRKDRFIRWLNNKILFNKMKKIIVSYHNAVNEIVDNYKISVNNLTVVYLPRMKELEFEDIKKKKIEKIYDFIFFGRIEEYKGLELLIRVMKDCPQFQLLIVGKGNYLSNILYEIDECDNITFINEYVSNRDLAIYIKKSKVVVLPYKTATGSQTVQISNYYGKPVLATRVGCFNEYVKNDINGIFIEEYSYQALKNSINIVMNKDEKQFSKLILENFQREFLIIKTVEKLEKLLDL